MAANETRNEVEVRSQKVDELRELGIEPYPSHSVQRSHTTQEIPRSKALPWNANRGSASIIIL
ncbi:hypothetical protein [Planktothrix agardhii]|uniref:hypothetical protein n=1 Tax=Planktothrix agardhii TaxID=1160 RepID=UPI0004080206|nr:hypothetical protein [Planktothrix agardhii]CAD0224124.1 hypothetical protein PL10110_230037 [Planktothrix agardhii]